MVRVRYKKTLRRQNEAARAADATRDGFVSIGDEVSVRSGHLEGGVQ